MGPLYQQQGQKEKVAALWREALAILTTLGELGAEQVRGWPKEHGVNG